MKSKNKKIITGFVIIVLILLGIITKNQDIINYIEKNYDIDLGVKIEEKYKENTAIKVQKCEVVRVVDGDTIVVKYNGKDEKVRLIGIDTPESVHPNESKNTVKKGLQEKQ